MNMNTIHVTASWDNRAKVWVATSDDVPGLVTEASDVNALKARLEAVIPELLRENGLLEPTSELEMPMELLVQDTLRATKPS